LKRTIITSAIVALCSLPLTASIHTLWYDTPAFSWETHALPIGNGSLGAMLFGGTDAIVMQFNQDTLWEGNTQDTGRYQSFGHLKFTFKKNDTKPNGYRRMLDISKATHSVTYSKKGVAFHRRAFASFPDQAIYMQCEASKPKQYSGTMALIDDHGTASQVVGTDRLQFSGKLKNGMRYSAMVKVIAEGGNITIKGNTLFIDHANSLRFILVAGTDYTPDHTRQWRSGKAPQTTVTKQLDKASAVPAKIAFARHLTDYQPLFN